MIPRYLAICCLFACLGCAADAPGVPLVAEVESGNASLIRNPVADHQEPPADTADVARLTFDTPEYQFGSVPEGKIVRHAFSFTNTGSRPLLITDARSTCGCTIPEFPERPIPPGGTGKVTVEFNTTHKYGRQRKPVMLTANTFPAMTTIYVDGTVINE